MGRKGTLPGQGNSIRAWRESKAWTLERVVARLQEDGLPITSASLSRIERGIQPYSQPILEGLARAFQCQPADLVMRKPPSKEQIELFSVIEGLDDEQRRRALAVLRAAFQAA